MSVHLPLRAMHIRTRRHTARPKAQRKQATRRQTTEIALAARATIRLSSQLSFVSLTMIRWIPLFLSFLCATTAQDPTPAPSGWGGCINPDDPTASTLVRIGQPTAICLTIGPGGDWAVGVPYLRFIFTPKADVYSRFDIPKSYQDIVNGDTVLAGRNLTVFTASQTILSFLRVYYDPKKGRIFPYLTAIIDVTNGVVQGIAWDNACVFCSSDLCIENTFNFAGQPATNLEGQSKGCYLEKATCDAMQPKGDKDCDIKLFVVWTGTDVKGQVFQSSGNRFSAFPPGRIQDRINDLIPDLPELPDLGIT